MTLVPGEGGGGGGFWGGKKPKQTKLQAELKDKIQAQYIAIKGERIGTQQWKVSVKWGQMNKIIHSFQ